MRVGGWVRGQSWKVGSRRKPEAIWKAKLEGWHSAKVGGWPEGTAGGVGHGASRWFAQRFNRRIDQRRKPMVGATVGLDDLLKAQAEERSEDWAGRLIKGASWREVGRRSRRMQQPMRVGG